MGTGAVSGRAPECSSRASDWARRVFWFFLCAASAAGLVAFSLTHPFGVTGSSLAVAVIVGIFLARRGIWLSIVPALTPVVDLVPWTGIVFLTESDALVLCAVLAAALQEVAGGIRPH